MLLDCYREHSQGSPSFLTDVHVHHPDTKKLCDKHEDKGTGGDSLSTGTRCRWTDGCRAENVTHGTVKVPHSASSAKNIWDHYVYDCGSRCELLKDFRTQIKVCWRRIVNVWKLEVQSSCDSIPTGIFLKAEH